MSEYLCFLKIIILYLKLKFKPIFVDESKVEMINNHYKAWRFPNEELLFGNLSKRK